MKAIDAVLGARRSGVRRMLVCLPTGAGKTVIFSHLAQLAKRQVLVLAHREELLGQARDKLMHALEGEHVLLDFAGVCRLCDDKEARIDAKAWVTLYLYQQMGQLV